MTESTKRGELLPCPWDGKIPKISESNDSQGPRMFHVNCSCGASRIGFSKEEAIELWNRRPAAHSAGEVEGKDYWLERLFGEYLALVGSLNDSKETDEANQLVYATRREVESLHHAAQVGVDRDSVLEEAAKVADSIAGNHKDFDRERRKGAGQVAAAVRALKSQGSGA